MILGVRGAISVPAAGWSCGGACPSLGSTRGKTPDGHCSQDPGLVGHPSVDSMAIDLLRRLLLRDPDLTLYSTPREGTLVMKRSPKAVGFPKTMQGTVSVSLKSSGHL